MNQRHDQSLWFFWVLIGMTGVIVLIPIISGTGIQEEYATPNYSSSQTIPHIGHNL